MNRIKIYQCNCTHCHTIPHNCRKWVIQHPQPGTPENTRNTFQAALRSANTYLKVTAK